MLTRRSFLGLSAALTGSALFSRPVRAEAATPDTFTLNLVNEAGSASVYATVTGTAPDGRLVLLKADGTPYYPASPASTLTPLPEDCALAVGAGRQVSVPKMAGARIYVSTGEPLDFFLNPGPALVHPSFLNTSDPNFTRNWSFAEFTFDDIQLYANISYVDFAGLPLGLSLTTASSGTRTVAGLPSGSVAPIAAELTAQGANWAQLVQNGPDGRVLRVLSAHHRPEAFSGYLDGYLDQVWQRYSGQDLVVDSQNPALGSFTGRVRDGLLVFGNGESFAKPSTADVWSCDSGPFAIPAGSSDARRAIVPRLAAALNRTTLLDNPNQPDGEDPARFYQNAVTNHYARIVHSKLPDNRGYAFPYDDVTPGPDFSGAVIAGDPVVLGVRIGATAA
ncbi:glycoside hydrolase family 64 protein [Amycolatopsis cynarae]|uniref:Glycoside hydrolase family 64 protein n=1 Tax=Amycolatopsis cynarae TaxID=2995223 RepID=A0ABY7AXD9_9PSEU|nr:glycoside hydrolase family 64 protein [Amycolatopsis sp. HUAS 11-8]WAL63293.1 glycoside hydrolase family 64 protein [Amycolatopsis sp. HUAS 11-8]